MRLSATTFSKDPMVSPTAVCYVASEGYLFQTVLSATQARAHSPADTPIVIAHFGDVGGESTDFRRVCAEHRITLVPAARATLGGLHVSFGRLFLDQLIPGPPIEMLYLDGDTQVVGDLTPLLVSTAPEGGLIGVLDPMVFIRMTSRHFMKKVDGWWDDGAIPENIRPRYVNSGVLRFSAAGLATLRERVLDLQGTEPRRLPFPDQDLINRAAPDRIRIAPIDWNFPGFLLNTRVARATQPRIVHFMSDPRPWDGPLPPWGSEWARPYEHLVKDYPETSPHWVRASRMKRARYQAQQRYKQLTERRLWQTPRSESAFDQYRRAADGLPTH